MNQIDRAKLLTSLHVKGKPLVLFNIWDAGSARALQEASAKAIASGSWSVAAAHGCEDGEDLPLELSLANARRIVGAIELPVTIDFESAYGGTPETVAGNAEQLIATGAVGCNFEDQIVGGEGVYAIEEQGARIRAMREAAERAGIPFFINARTDLFLQSEPAEHGSHLEEAVRRAEAYAEAGASGFFAPGLCEPDQIRALCDQSPLPVNIMMMPGVPAPKELATLGVARISHGPGPYREMIDRLKEAAQAAFQW